MVLMKGKVKDKEHLKLRCLVQVGPDNFVSSQTNTLSLYSCYIIWLNER